MKPVRLAQSRCENKNSASIPELPTAVAWPAHPTTGVHLMIPTRLIRFRCPAGHRLKAPHQAAGRSAICPTCQTVLEIPNPIPEPPVTESGVARMLGDLNSLSTARHRLEEAPRAMPVAAPKPSRPQRRCDRCSKLIDQEATLCVHCRTMQVPAESRIRSIIGQASRQMLRRRRPGN